MIYQLYAIKDRAIDAFQPMSCCRAEGEAIRAFQDAIANPQNRTLHTHPDDYDLYHIGEYDDQTGIITQKEIRKAADGKQLAMTQGD